MSPTGTPSLTEQATTILAAAKTLQASLTAAGLPQPTFDAGGRRDWHDASPHPAILQARADLIDASQALLDLALGPADALTSLTGPAVHRLEVLRTLDSLGVAGAVPPGGEGIAYAELAARLGVREGPLRRHLRFAYLLGLFRESDGGEGVAHTALSEALPAHAPYLRLRTSPLFTDAVREVPRAMKREDGVAAQMADAAGRDMWTVLKEDYPDGPEMFALGMKASMNAYVGENLTSYVEGFDWASLGGGKTLVDVGGANGHVAITVARQIPADVRFVVQDLPSNAEECRELVDKHGMRGKVEFQAQDFFTPQPGGLSPQVYLLSRVLHDWKDEDCVRILGQLVPAMETHGTKLWVAERVLPDGLGHMPNYMEQKLRGQDLLMYTLFGSGERTATGWQELFTKAHPRLRVSVLKQPLNCVLSFMEVVLE